jgi:predicted enzyme related to lactoylglutathione lyase
MGRDEKVGEHRFSIIGPAGALAAAPTREAPTMRATISHFEIPTRQLDRAARFYLVVFGWESEPRPSPGGAYRVLHGPAGADGQAGIDGGLLQSRGTIAAPQVAAAHGAARDAGDAPDADTAGDPRAVHDLGQPLLVIHVTGAPLWDCLDLVVAEGGEVDLPVTEVGPSGRFARFRDPEGNLLGLWQEIDWAHPRGS